MALEQLGFGSNFLNGAISDSALSLVVDDAASFSAAGYFRCKIDDEIVLVTTRSGATFTITRAQEGTSAAAHLDDAPVVQVFTPTALARLLPSPKRIASNLTVTSSTVLVNITEWVWAANANEGFDLDFDILYDAHASGDFKFGLTVPAGAAYTLSAMGPDDTVTNLLSTAITSGSVTFGGGGAGTKKCARVRAHVLLGSTAGNIQAQFAQGTSNGTGSILLAGSQAVAQQYV